MIPAPVRHSFLCWVAACVVVVLGTAVTLGGSIARPGGPLAGQDADRGAGVVATGLLVLMMIAVLAVSAAIVSFAVQMRAGRNWARIVLTVVGLLLALSNLPTAFGAGGQNYGPAYGPVLASVSAIVTSSLMIAGVVLQWHRDTQPYFAPPRCPVARPL